MWFNSQLINGNIIDEESLSKNTLYKNNILELKKLNVTKENYKKLIQLCDFLMIDNPDRLINKILQIYDYDYNIIYDFEDFYKYNTKKLKPFNMKKDLKKALKLHCDNHKKCFHTYGFTSFWDVSNINDMSNLFS